MQHKALVTPSKLMQHKGDRTRPALVADKLTRPAILALTRPAILALTRPAILALTRPAILGLTRPAMLGPLTRPSPRRSAAGGPGGRGPVADEWRGETSPHLR